MKKLYDFMYRHNVGDGPVGKWKISNHYAELQFLFERFPSLKWHEPNKLLYSSLNVERTAAHLGLPSTTVQEWLDDPEFECYKETVVDFRSLDKSEDDVKQFLCKFLDLSLGAVSIFLQDQRPGGITPWHLDGKKHLQYKLSADQEHLIQRYIIFLEDQKPGQFWQINDDFIKWRKGDILTWDQSTSPHGTANAGYHNRPVIMVTGTKSIA